MSIKSLIQIFIFLIIISIIAAIYYRYFDINKNVVEEISSLENNNQERLKELERKIKDLELQNNELVLKIDNSKIRDDILHENKQEKVLKVYEDAAAKENVKKSDTQSDKISSDEIKNLVKNIEYTSIDERGNKFKLLANSGKSNSKNNDILDLINVKGEITSDNRDTIYIVSDFAQFNSVNSNSKFYDNVIINYQEKQITSINFDINMETNKAIAYNDVLITDPKSTMKAGLVEFDLKTKNININPETSSKDIQIITN